MHVITGLPRSGSTLLCNLLNQNPAFYASSTSILPGLLAGLVQAWSGQELIGALIRDRQAAQEKLQRVAQTLCETWHDKPGRVVFDKSRGWLSHLSALWTTFPDAKVIVTVRDLRGVFGSIERQHRKNGLLDDTSGAPDRPLAFAKSVFGRADVMFGPTGLVGGPLLGLQDVYQRCLEERVLFVRLEDLAASPKFTMSKVYEHLDLPMFEHDYENVVNTAEDKDELNLLKFPHEGSGEIRPLEANDWSDVINDEIATLIKGKFGWFYKAHYEDKPVRVHGKNGGGRTTARGVLNGKG